MSSLQWILVFSICATLLLTTKAGPEADKITSLPGQPQVTFQQHSGYITIDEHQKKALFYYFVEAETDPASKPLVLWLNGGIFPLMILHQIRNNLNYMIYINNFWVFCRAWLFFRWSWSFHGAWSF